jgi:phosphoribosylformylglycinamidine synthase
MEERMSDLRFFVEKKKGFDLDAKRLEKQFREELGVNVKNLRLINCYDIFNLNDNKEDIEKIKKMILSEPVTDTITTELDLNGKNILLLSFYQGNLIKELIQLYNVLI